MESQKIINLLDHKDEDDPRFETRNWYIINDHNNGNYSQGVICVIILMLIF